MFFRESIYVPAEKVTVEKIIEEKVTGEKNIEEKITAEKIKKWS